MSILPNDLAKTNAPSVASEAVLLAFDFGTVRIGVAIGNTLSCQARALSTIHSKVNQVRFDTIEKLLNEWQPKLLIVGKPLHPDGTPHEMTARAKKFANQLHGRFRLPVCLVDERYTSAIAEGEGASKDDVDALAAQIILQHFFDEVADITPFLLSHTVTQSHEKPAI